MAAFYSSEVLKIIQLRRDGARRVSARELVAFSDAYIVDHFKRLGYSVNYDQLVFTIEPVAEFIDARHTVWHQPGIVSRVELPGLLIVEDAQPHKLQPTRDIIVVSLGYAQVVMGVMNRQGQRRFATTM